MKFESDADMGEKDSFRSGTISKYPQKIKSGNARFDVVICLLGFEICRLA